MRAAVLIQTTGLAAAAAHASSSQFKSAQSSENGSPRATFAEYVTTAAATARATTGTRIQSRHRKEPAALDARAEYPARPGRAHGPRAATGSPSSSLRAMLLRN